MSKHLLIEVEVTDKGQEYPGYVQELIKDSVSEHISRCIASESDRKYFILDDFTFPRVRVLTEDIPL